MWFLSALFCDLRKYLPSLVVFYSCKFDNPVLECILFSCWNILKVFVAYFPPSLNDRTSVCASSSTVLKCLYYPRICIFFFSPFFLFFFLPVTFDGDGWSEGALPQLSRFFAHLAASLSLSGSSLVPSYSLVSVRCFCVLGSPPGTWDLEQ